MKQDKPPAGKSSTGKRRSHLDKYPAKGRFHPILLAATGFGFGYSPFMPGTVGALWGLPLAWLVAMIPAVGPIGAIWLKLAAIGVICLLGIPLCSAAAIRLGVKDPSAVVFDEIATMPIVFLFVTAADMASRPWILILGFVLHRLFDITKPPPCRQLERLPAGLGIMSDDVAAAGYALLCLQGVMHFIVPHLGG
ncbi:MAG: phosphatidylglycerophosphatase A [Planctomycetia bacterium]|nr:phosphatidylglycerophosphatase A [Planctomycetia bacterium]